MQARSVIASALAAVLLGGCGGAGTSITPAPQGAPGSQTPTSSSKGSVAFVIKVPAKPAGAAAKNHRSPQWITSNVQGVSISAINGATGWGYNNFYPLGASQPYCTSASSGLTCTLALTAPAGSVVFTVQTWDMPNVSGWYVSSGTLTATITAGALNTINIVTGGTIAYLLANVDNPQPSTGASATIAVRTLAADFDGNIIVGPFDDPVSVVDSDTSGITTPNATSIPDSTTLANFAVAYSGASLASPATITLQTTSIYSADDSPLSGGPVTTSFTLNPGATGMTLTPSLIVFPSSATNTPAQSFTSSGGTAPYTNGSDSCTSIGHTIHPCGLAVSISGSSPTYSLTPTNQSINGFNTAMTDLLPVSDNNGHTATVDIFIP